MALPLTDTDKFLLLHALGAPETRDRVVALLDLAGTGNVTGPGSSTDNAIVRFDGTTGALVQSSSVIVSDAGAITGVTSLNGITSATLAFVDFTSSGQTQLNGKVNDTGDTLTGALLFPAGTAGAPSISFSGEPDSGLYLAGGAIRFSFNATEVFQYSPARMDFNTGTHLYGDDGTAALPFYSFGSDTNTGIYRVTTDVIGFAAAGVRQFTIDTTKVAFDLLMLSRAAGTAGAPVFSFDNDPDTGMYNSGANALAFSTGGINGINISSTQAVTLGTGTAATHRLNTALVTADTEALTLTNGPVGTAGNPDVYLRININGTNYAIPAWAV